MLPTEYRECPYTFRMNAGDQIKQVQVNFIRLLSRNFLQPFTNLLVLNPYQPYHEIKVETIYESELPIHEEFKLQLQTEDLRFNATEEAS
jgi:hypothetical protein